MKSLVTVFRQLVLLVVLAAPLAIAQANDRGGPTSGTLKGFETAAVVDRVNSVELIAEGKRYRYNAPLNFLEGSLKASVQLLKAGDHVWLKGRILNGVHYIDAMSVLPSDSDA